MKNVLIFALSLSAQSGWAQGYLNCQSLFNGVAESVEQMPRQSRLDAVLLSHTRLFDGLESRLFVETKAGQSLVRARIGRFGSGAHTFDEIIDLQHDKIIGAATRNPGFPEEGHALDLQVRPASSPNDIFKVSLGSEMDSLGYLAAKKLKLPITLVEDLNAKGFVVHAGVARASLSGLGASGETRITIGQGWTVVGIETSRPHRHGEPRVTLRLLNAQTKQVHEIESRTRSQGLQSLERILSGETEIVANGRTFGVMPKGRTITRLPL